MGKLRIMNATGDTTLTWDPAVADETAVVKAKFDEMIKRGFMAYQTDTALAAPSRSVGSVVRTFDPLAEEIVIAIPMQGG